MNTLWYIQMVEYYSAMKRIETDTHNNRGEPQMHQLTKEARLKGFIHKTSLSWRNCRNEECHRLGGVEVLRTDRS